MQLMEKMVVTMMLVRGKGAEGEEEEEESQVYNVRNFTNKYI